MTANGPTKPAGASLPLLAVADRAELRAWLEHNHASSPGVNLAIGKKGGRATALTYDDAVEEALCFGWIDSTARRLDDDRYTVLFTPRKRGGTWARTNKVRVERLIAEGRMTPAGISVIEAAKADGSWMRARRCREPRRAGRPRHRSRTGWRTGALRCARRERSADGALLDLDREARRDPGEARFRDRERRT